MKKYIISSLTITIIVFISIFVSIPNKDNKILSKLVKNDTLAFTVDGKSVNEMPTKGSGYIASTIKCNKGSNFIWDNDNWEIEITDMKDKDKCVINFTKDTSNSNVVTIVKGESVTTSRQYKDSITYNYNGTDGTDGSVQKFTAPVTGNYDLQVWGASGGNSSSGYLGGNGGYSKGTISLNKDDVLYIYVGGKGLNGVSGNTSQAGGYNGGGKSSGSSFKGFSEPGGSGGGATHIAKVDGLLSTLSASTSNILLVAGAGGGAANYSGYIGGAGGGTTGTTGIGYSTSRQATAGSQTAGGAPGYNATTEMTGSFGKGGDAYSNSSRYTFSGGGGAGFYGGGGGSGRSGTNSSYSRYTSGGGGGSGYINPSLTNASTLDGTQSTIPTVDGTGTETGHTGNGAAVIDYDITREETIEPMEINSILDSSSKTVSSDGSIIFYPKRNATLISVSGCNATIEDNKLIIKNITSSMECKLSGTATAMYDKLLSDNPTIKTRTNLAGVYQSSNTKTLYKIQENGTDVYYFSGNAQNNWVKFGDFYWRIIRTNADRSIRLLYHGTSTDSTSAYITVDNNSSTCYYKDTSGNCLYNDKSYVNYSTSYVKKTLEKWYQDNLKNKYDNFVSTSAIYCNDTSEPSTSGQFGSYTRLITNKTPTYDCSGDNVYTKDNGKLNYPIGLISVDEVSYAGGISAKNSTAYFYYNSTNSQSSVNDNWWWTMSPYMWNNSIAFQFIISGTSDSGQIGGNGITGTYAVRPVLSIKGNNAWKSGDGSSSNPYEIVTE